MYSCVKTRRNDCHRIVSRIGLPKSHSTVDGTGLLHPNPNVLATALNRDLVFLVFL